MKNSCPVILSSVVLSFFVSISGGVQGQDFGTCDTTNEFIDGDTVPFYNSQTIYSILCEDRFENADYLNPNFTTLCDLLSQTPEVKNILDNPSAGITFFAPDNTAFVVVNTTGNPESIRAVLETHILPNPYLLKELPCGECQCTIGVPCRTRTRTVCTNAGSTYQVGGGNDGLGGIQEFPEIGQPLGPNKVFSGNEDGFNSVWGPGNSNIIRTNEEGWFSEDAVACNGIIHAVDKLILPGVGGRNPQCGTTPGGKGSKSNYGDYGGYSGKGTKEYGGYSGYGGKGQKGGYGGKGQKGRYYTPTSTPATPTSTPATPTTAAPTQPPTNAPTAINGRKLDMEDTFFEDEDEDEDEVEGEEEDSSVVPPQNDAHSSTSEERSQRRKRFLETLINPNGEIEPLE